jgi:hypothetical protein
MLGSIHVFLKNTSVIFPQLVLRIAGIVAVGALQLAGDLELVGVFFDAAVGLDVD